MLTVLPTQADTRDGARQERASTRRERVSEADGAETEQSQADQEVDPAGPDRDSSEVVPGYSARSTHSGGV